MDGLDVLLVDGKLTPATGGGTFETVDPATEEVLAVAADGSPADLDAAVAAARRAFDETTGRAGFEEYLELKAVAEAV
jgi:aldehyde dehydrogenase (NAD+)